MAAEFDASEFVDDDFQKHGMRLSNIPVLGALLNNLDLQQYGYTYRKSYYDYYESNEEKADGRGQKAEGRR